MPDEVPAVNPATGKPFTNKEKKKYLKALRREKALAKKNGAGGGVKVPDKTPALKKKAKKSKRSSGKPLPTQLAFDDPRRVQAHKKGNLVARLEVSPNKRIEMFRHLPQYKRHIPSLQHQRGVIHPSIIRLGFKYSENTISGANSRCRAMIAAFSDMIADFTPDESQAAPRISDQLVKAFKSAYRLLIDCRVASISMGNFFTWLKSRIILIDTKHRNLPWPKWREMVRNDLMTFSRDRIEYAVRVISSSAVEKIKNGSVVLTYGRSFCVERTLLRAHEKGKKFRVIVVDSRPRCEGRELMKTLAEHGLEVSYCLLNAISYVGKEATICFLGAASILSNGSVFSRVGTSMVAMVVRHLNVPAIVLCETYKFSERVNIDSICYNELGDPDDLVLPDVSSDQLLWGNDLSEWHDIKNLKILNLTYDVTPAMYISMVITEMGTVPSTSVPVIIREFSQY